jgi:hypothetical protein
MLDDLNAPWILSRLPEFEFSLFVIPRTRDAWLAQYRAPSFRSWAEMWNLGFEEWDTIAPQLPGARQGIVELRPDERSTAQFWENFAKLFPKGLL